MGDMLKQGTRIIVRDGVANWGGKKGFIWKKYFFLDLKYDVVLDDRPGWIIPMSGQELLEDKNA